VTVTASAGTTVRFAIHEYGGIFSSSPVDVFASTQGSTSPNSGNVTTAQASKLLFAASAVGGSPTWTAGTGYTLRQTPVNVLGTEDQIVSSTGTFAGAFSISASDNWSAGVVAFKGLLPAYTNVTNNFTAQQNFGADVRFKGPNPHVDIRAFGARFVNANTPPGGPGITASCVNGNTSVTISSASMFVNGDGVALRNCGAATGLTTPGTPMIVPSVAAGPTGTGMVVNAPAGSTSYQYQIVALTTGGGWTPAGTAGTTSAGLSSLGFQSVNITSLSKTNQTVTVNTASAHGLSVGSNVCIQNTTDSQDFGGWYIVATVPDRTHFTYLTPSDSRGGGQTSATSGTAGWFNENHITWSPVTGAWIYLIYGRTSGSTALVGVSKPQDSANGISDPSWDDFGATMSPPPTLLPHIPTTPPGAGANNDLITTISSGAGTTTLTLAASPSVTLASQTIVVDACPGMVAAGGNLLIPQTSSGPTGIVVSSYCSLSSATAILQLGSLTINGTLQLGNNVQWYGDVLPAQASVPSFANQGGRPIVIGYSLPGVYLPGSSSTLVIKGLNFQGPNNATHIVIDGTTAFTVEDTNFGGAGGAEQMTMPLLVRNGTFQNRLRNVTMLGTASGNSTTPLFFCNYCSTLKIDLLNLSGRGVLFNGVGFEVNYGRIQGGTMPVFVLAPLSGAAIVGGVGSVDYTFPSLIHEYELDTAPQPLVANLTPSSSKTGIHGILIEQGAPSPSSDSGGALPVITGNPFPNVITTGVVPPGQTNSWMSLVNYGQYGVGNVNGHPTYGTCNLNNACSEGQLIVAENVNIQAGNGLTVPFAVPVPAVSVSTSCGGSFPAAGTYFYALTVVGPEGVESSKGVYSAGIPLNGTTQCSQLNWSDASGVTNYKVYVTTSVIATNPQLIFAGGCASNFSGIQVNNCIDNRGTGSGSSPTLNGTGNPSLYPGMLSTNRLIMGSSTGGKYGTNTLHGNFTATRSTTLPDGNGTVPVVASLTTTAAASDNVAIQGVTSSSHCTMTPTNATAATDSTGTFVSAKAANQITVTHPANAGRTWDISCTAN